MLKVKNRVKSLSLFVALCLSLFGLQTIFVNTASAGCGAHLFCNSYPADSSTITWTLGSPVSVQMTFTGGSGSLTSVDFAGMGGLPTGMSVTAGGFISGTPIVLWNQTGVVGISDTVGDSASITNLTIRVVSAPVPSAQPSPPAQKASVAGYSPTSGPTAGGTVVTISGSFPDSISQVHIDNVAISGSLWKQTTTGVTITMPAHAAGPVSIQIYNGQGPVLSAQTFTYTDVAPTPTPTPSATPTATPTPTPSATPTPTPTPAPAPKLALKAVVNFGNDSSALDAAAKSAIEKIAEKINNSSASVIYLYGYTDVRGDAAYNLGLSKRRAQSVSDYLRPLLTNLTLQVAWRGAKNPAASGNSEADYAKNRRVEIWAK